MKLKRSIVLPFKTSCEYIDTEVPPLYTPPCQKGLHILLDNHTDLPMAHFSGSGPMARTFQDMVLMYSVIAGPGPLSVNVAPSPEYPLTYQPISGLKIAYLGGMGITELSKDTAAAMVDAIKVLKQQGAIVDTVKFDFELTENLTEIFGRIVLAGSMGGMFRTMPTRRPDDSLWQALHRQVSNGWIWQQATPGWRGLDHADVRQAG